MCLVVGRCVPVGETRTLTVNSAGESQIANLEPPSGWLLDGLGRNTLRSPGTTTQVQVHVQPATRWRESRRWGKRPARRVSEHLWRNNNNNNKVINIHLLANWAVARALKLMSLHQGLHSKGQGFITHGVTR